MDQFSMSAIFSGAYEIIEQMGIKDYLGKML